MKFSIITPTMERKSLLTCCASVDSQSFFDWEHIVMADVALPDLSLMNQIKHPNRKLKYCGTNHCNYGNSCRHNAWRHATGEWIIWLDDDNALSDTFILEDIAMLLERVKEQWAIFPILRHGHEFFNDPPGNCLTDTMNMVMRREVAQWPDGHEYTMDGLFCEQLKAKYPYKAFPDMRPIGIMEQSSLGK